MKREYIECQCSTIEHTLRFTWDDGPDWPDIYVDVYLNQHYGFFKRFWYGMKYIFGYKSVYGHFDETTLSYEQIEQLRSMCERWLETHYKTPETLKQKLMFAEASERAFMKKLNEARQKRYTIEKEIASSNDEETKPMHSDE